jgi:hypothetical protein
MSDTNQTPVASQWASTIQGHFKDMKFREDECRRKAYDLTLKADAIRSELNSLESTLYKAELIQ